MAIKTNKELSIRDVEKAVGLDKRTYGSLAAFIRQASLDDVLERLKDIVPLEKKRLEYYKYLEKYIKKYIKSDEYALKLIKEKVKQSEELVELDEKRTKSQKLINAALSDGNKMLQAAIKNNHEIFKISHEMQLESNVTWKNYTKLYNEAYKSVREMNKEIGQSVYNVKDLVETQNKLLGTGWKNIDTGTLTSVSTATALLGRTLGKLDERLANAFQSSFRFFGAQTDQFVTAVGNRLNAFSNTFGVQIGMLQGAVVDMMASNSFISRSNMNSQIKANESLIKAAALSGAIGLTTTTFLSNLATTAQFGTMEQMASIYQGGALVQGFDTSKFQQNMNNQNYYDATKDLFSGIYDTLNGIDDHYLRAEYMQRIGGTFGLSQADMLNIASFGGNLEKYDEDLTGKLLDVNTSMVDELSDLKVGVIDRIDNWVQNTWVNQKMGAVMQELGLYGISGLLKVIMGQLTMIIGQGMKNKLGGVLRAETGSLGGVKNWLGQTSTTKAPFVEGFGSTGIGMSNGGRLIKGAGGLAIGTIGNIAGSAIQQNQNMSDASANIIGGGINIGSGAAGGAMLGSAILPGVGTIVGAGIGAVAGGINTIVQANKRKEAQKELDDSQRTARAAKLGTPATGDPIVDAINRQTDVLVGTLDGNAQSSRSAVATMDTYNKTKTYDGVS